MYGLSSEDLHAIIQVLKQYPQIKEARIFGSRAMGTHRVGSDVDIALEGADLEDIVAAVSGRLNDETPLPYMFDVVIFSGTGNVDLQDHIQRVGIPFYTR